VPQPGQVTTIRFDVFGRVLAVRRHGDFWRVYSVGTDGKLGQTGIVIPEFITEDELARYLADLFHEDARPGMDDVRRLPPF
jgi:hypothetical protein